MNIPEGPDEAVLFAYGTSIREVLFYACLVCEENQIGAPSREYIADKKRSEVKQARLASDC